MTLYAMVASLSVACSSLLYHYVVCQRVTMAAALASAASSDGNLRRDDRGVDGVSSAQLSSTNSTHSGRENVRERNHARHEAAGVNDAGHDSSHLLTSSRTPSSNACPAR